MKKSNDTIGNRTRDLPACSAVTAERIFIKFYIVMAYVFQTFVTI